MYFDSHFHFESIQEKDPSYQLPESLIGLDVAIEAGDLENRIKRIEKCRNEGIFLSAGSGPWALERDGFISIDDEISTIEKEIEEFGTDAIGEAGFDRYWNYGTIEDQKGLFYNQAELARKYDRALIIHSRDADDELEESIPHLGDRVIFHCFSSGKNLMYKALDRGAYISFSANISFKGSEKQREAARLCPIDRLLYETDSPYLAPRDKGGRINTPERTEFTLAYLSELRGEEREKIKESVISNFYRVLGYRKSKVTRTL